MSQTPSLAHRRTRLSWRNLPRAGRGALMLLLAATLALGLLAAGNVWRTAEAEIARAGDRQEEAARLLERHVLRSLQVLDLFARNLAGRLAQEPDLAAVPPTLDRAVRAEIASIPQVADLLVADRTGTVRYALDPAALGRSVADQAFFQAHLDGKDTYFVGRPVGEWSNGRVWLVPVSWRLEDRDGSFRGILTVGMNAADLGAFFSGLGPQGTVFATLADEWNRPIVTLTPEGQLLIGTDATAGSMPLAQDGEPARLWLDVGSWSGDLIVVARTLKAAPLRVAAGVPYETALAAARSQAVAALAGLLAAFLPMALLALWIVRLAMRQRRVEQDLAHAMERFDLTVSGSNDGIWEADLAAGTLSLSAAGARMLGYGQDTVLPWDLPALVHAEDLPLAESILRRHLAGESDGFSATVRLRRADDSWLWVDIRGRSIRNDGSVERLVGTFSNMQARKMAELALENSERRLRDLVDGSIQGICVHRDFRPLFVNEAFARIYGFDSPADLLMLGDLRSLMPADVRDNAAVRQEQLFQGEMPDAPARFENLRRDGRRVWVDVMARVVDWAGAPAIQITVVDVSQHVESQDKLLRSRAELERLAEDLTAANRALQAAREEAEVGRREAEESRRFLETLLDTIPSPVFYKDLHGRYLGYNKAFAELHGVEGDAAIGKTVHDLLPRALADTHRRAERTLLEQGGTTTYEAPLAKPGDPKRHLLVSKAVFRNPEGKPAGIIAVTTDISDRIRLEAQLRLMASEDLLTGALNRQRFLEVAEVERLRMTRHRRPLSLLMLDLDRFKEVNDRYGSAVSDTVLRAAVKSFKDELRRSDLVGRMDGTEFAILLPETGLRHAVEVAERLRARVERMDVPTDDGAVRVTVSVGVVEVRPDLGTGATIAEAETRLREAKAAGRNRVVAARQPVPAAADA